jgi:hypothetical protein
MTEICDRYYENLRDTQKQGAGEARTLFLGFSWFL